ncbi:MAG TPA: right-handed parallel beta-helix repeat-containing protein [Phycisphaerae bacterium]|jgi:hypothetical protein|nr:right-handed parallel beta-helix repeat-containing protein [Phycisphaerae bacterium]
MVQGKREFLMWGLACAIAGKGNAARARAIMGLGVESLEDRVNLSALAGAGGVQAAQAGVQSTAKPVITLEAALGGGDKKGFSDVIASSGQTILRRGRPTRTWQSGSNQTLVPAAILTPNAAPAVQPSAPAAPAPSPSPSPAAPAVTPASDPLATLRGQLHGDGVHDDSGTIQAMIDTAYTQGLHTITLPAGVFVLDKTLWFYGSSVTLSGQGTSTVLEVANHHDGLGNDGWALRIAPQFDNTLYMATQAVTGDTITLRGQVSLQAGEMLFLTNGRGSMALVEQKLGGSLTQATDFNELAPDEYVQVASVSTDATGNTVVKLTKNVVGTNDYFNVAPSGVVNDHYLHVSRLIKPADHLTVSDLAIQFSDPQADSSLFTFYTTYTTIKNVTLLDSKALHAGSTASGAFWSEGSEWTTFENITAPQAPIDLNSCRFATISGNTASRVALEEGTTDSVITHNTFTTTTFVSIRTNDMGCQRDTFSYNTMHGGLQDTGAIGIWEGLDITLENNTVTGPFGSLWLGRTRGCQVLNNIAGGFANYDPLGGTIVTANSWQK